MDGSTTPNAKLSELLTTTATCEHAFTPMRIEGALPESLRGTLYRTGPAAFEVGGRGAYKSPAQRATDFVDQIPSTAVPECSYPRGVAPCDLREVLPPVVAEAVAQGLPQMDRRWHGRRGRLLGSMPWSRPEHAVEKESVNRVLHLFFEAYFGSTGRRAEPFSSHPIPLRLPPNLEFTHATAFPSLRLHAH